jgi:2-methylfumaryl-CoA hydratase
VIDTMDAPVNPSTWPVIPRSNPFEEHVVGRVFAHHWGRTLHASDNVGFTTQMLAFNPVHFNRDLAVERNHPDEVINPMLVFTTVFGLSVEDLSEAGGPFLGASDVRFLRDVYPGDTLYASSTVVDARESGSRPDVGIVTWHTTGRDGLGRPVIEFHRTNLVPKRDSDAAVAPVPDGFAEDFGVGDRFRHARTRTVTDIDLNSLTLLVMNTASGHFSEQEMVSSSFGERINFGGLTLALTIGLATQDTTGQAIREVGLDAIKFEHPVRRGDTIGAATEVLSVQPSGSEATVTFRHFGFNQRREIVCRADREVLVRSRAADDSDAEEIPTSTSVTPIGR